MLRLQKRKTRFSDFAQNVTIQTFRATLQAAAPTKISTSLYINGLSEILKGDFLEIAQVLSKHLPFAKIANTDFPESISKAESYGFVQKTLDAHFQISTFDSVFQLILAGMGSGQ